MTAFCRAFFVVTGGLAVAAGWAQPLTSQPEPAVQPLALKAEILLSPEFCATKQRQSASPLDVLKVGKQACEQIYAVLMPAFAGLQKVDAAPPEGKAGDHVTLIPKFVAVSATAPPWPGMKMELILLLEWTILDNKGKAVWLQTVQGSSRIVPNPLKGLKWRRELIQTAMDDLAHCSAAKIAAAPEILKLQ